jgi:hypothetical protein
LKPNRLRGIVCAVDVDDVLPKPQLRPLGVVRAACRTHDADDEADQRLARARLGGADVRVEERHRLQAFAADGEQRHHRHRGRGP